MNQLAKQQEVAHVHDEAQAPLAIDMTPMAMMAKAITSGASIEVLVV